MPLHVSYHLGLPASNGSVEVEPIDEFNQSQVTLDRVSSSSQKGSPEQPHIEGVEKHHETSQFMIPDVSWSVNTARSSFNVPAPQNHFISHGHQKFQPRQSMFRGSTHSTLTDYSDMLESIHSFDIDEDSGFDHINATLVGGDQNQVDAISGIPTSALRSSYRFSRGSRRTNRDSARSILSDITDISAALRAIQMEEDDFATFGEGDPSSGNTFRRQSVRFEMDQQPALRRGGFAIDEFLHPLIKANSTYTGDGDVEDDFSPAVPNGDAADHVGMDISRASLKSRASVRFSLPSSSHVDFDDFISSDRELANGRRPSHGMRFGSLRGSASSLLRRSVLSNISMLTESAGYLESTDENEDEEIDGNSTMLWNAADTNAVPTTLFYYPIP